MGYRKRSMYLYFKEKIRFFLPPRAQLEIRYFVQWMTKKLEKEVVYAEQLVRRKRRFLDIGSNLGTYSYHYRNTFQNIDAFEPQAELSAGLKAINNIKITVHDCAVSDREGQLKLFIPVTHGRRMSSLASLREGDGCFEEHLVEVRSIDSFGFDDVDLMKIDVEGFEQSVLFGAVETIEKTRPVLIIEIEQRHLQTKIEEVFKFILNLGYQGFFFQNDVLIPLEEFSYEKNQKPFLENVNTSSYVNNFIFVSYSI